MKKYIGIKDFEAELILVDPKEYVKVEDDEKIDVFCQRLISWVKRGQKRFILTKRTFVSYNVENER